VPYTTTEGTLAYVNTLTGESFRTPGEANLDVLRTLAAEAKPRPARDRPGSSEEPQRGLAPPF